MIDWRGFRRPPATEPVGPPRILFVCMGNLCRSPMAEAIAKFTAREHGLSSLFDFDSVGTHDLGGRSRFDPRAIAALERNGYGSVPTRRPRVLSAQAIERSELILGMDNSNLASLRRVCPEEHAHKLGLFLDFSPGLEGTDVPDPYYGNHEGFDRVVDLCQTAVRGLLAALGNATPALQRG